MATDAVTAQTRNKSAVPTRALFDFSLPFHLNRACKPKNKIIFVNKQSVLLLQRLVHFGQLPVQAL